MFLSRIISQRPPRAVADPVREAYAAHLAAKAGARIGADAVTPVGIAANAIVGDAYPYEVLALTVLGGVIGTIRSGPIWGVVWLIGANIVGKLGAQGACTLQSIGKKSTPDCGRGNWIF